MDQPRAALLPVSGVRPRILEWKHDDSVPVRLTGQPGVKEFIAAEMGIALDR